MFHFVGTAYSLGSHSQNKFFLRTCFLHSSRLNKLSFGGGVM